MIGRKSTVATSMLRAVARLDHASSTIGREHAAEHNERGCRDRPLLVDRQDADLDSLARRGGRPDADAETFAFDDQLSPDRGVMEIILSEHACRVG